MAREDVRNVYVLMYLKYIWNFHKFKSITYTKDQNKFTDQQKTWKPQML